MITSLNGTPLSPLTFGTMQFGGNAVHSGSGGCLCFNGFGDAEQVLVADEPMASLYDGSRERPAADNVVSLR